ncbi:alpha-L-rhamnosidase C-terminal domain-containing protein [Agromyces archimandritae]|uniref:Alpha-L-rhamnosidase n=1 Tax=Agromyces archimandritae TaxID=2781962 RepID=A0A975FPC1_9MICO|nr:alpha-L-rhamnosidase C-terminal domain-containing protein [Agromyces archimandritae]QTX05357.1 hypothetical protein G127AT_03780 [Agromyces archimandritae]
MSLSDAFPNATAADLVARSRAAGADRMPDALARPEGFSWHYPAGQFEIGALHRLVDEGRAANRHVDYAANYADVEPAARFRTTIGPGDAFTLLGTGRMELRVDGVTSGTAVDGALRVPKLPAGTRIEVLVAADGEPAAIGAEAGGPGDVEWVVAPGTEGAFDGSRAVSRAGGLEPPHRVGEPEVRLPFRALGEGIHMLDAPALGVVEIRCTGRPALAVGESLDEALADPEAGESRTDLVEEAPGIWASRYRLGLRYARVSGVEGAELVLRASVRPVERRGAFACDDPVLERIWATSAFTLRQCLQVFLIDGIKRDRMPWIGDHALGILTNAYTVADREIVRNSLVALGRPRHGYINGIADYSLWWVIAHRLYQSYFGDREFLEQEGDRLHAFVADLAEHTGPDGVFRPLARPDAFAEAGPGSLFLDWGVSLRADVDATAVQLLWHWALTSAAELLAEVGHPGAEGWAALAARLERTLETTAWDAEAGAWREYLDAASRPSAYPNFLAVLSGMLPAAADGAAEAIRANPAGTPFMRAFALRGLGELGGRIEAVDELRRLWGRMLDAGAQTFWEEFADQSASPFEMYRRPYGKSLCHAWAAGPAMLLPELVLGVRPLADGWREFAVAPELGTLGWAAAVVPLPGGDLIVEARAGRVRVDVPAGSTLVHPEGRFPGPARLDLPA